MSQIALSMTLLAAAGLLVKSFARLMTVDPGYRHENVALAYIGLSPTRYPEAAQRADFFHSLEAMLEAHPGVQGVTRSDGRGFRSNVALEAEGRLPPRNQPYRIPSATIAPDYLDVMGVQLVAGRGFTAGDANTDAVIIDLDLARFLWADDAVGRRFRLGDDGEWLNVVGVVRDLRLMGRDQREGPYQILYPAAPESAGGWVQVAVHTAGDPATILDVIRDAVAALDPQQTIWQLQTAADALADDAAEPRFLVTLMGLLAIIAVVLAAVGLYGVLSYSVARRDRELAVRMAVGADARRLRAMVLGEGLAVTIGGVTLGILGTSAVSRLIEKLLYEVPPHDTATLAATTSLLLAVAALASLLPARRATRVNPSEILRRD
ncbi:MAG: FtsX-like permease family protein [Longimicrobiales bacterium]